MTRLFLLLLLLIPIGLSAQNISLIESRIKEVFSLPDLKSATYGLAITDLKTGRLLYSDNGEKLLIPASALKIATAAVAVKKLGEKKKVRTTLVLEGTLDKAGVLKGNIRIIGGGDPALGSKEHSGVDAEQVLMRWVGKIKKAGIKKITGDIIGDASCFQTEGEGKDWLYEDIGNHYGAFASGLCLNENKYHLILSSPAADNTACEIKSCYPVVPGLNHTSFVKTSVAKGEDVWILGGPGQNDRKVVGTLPPGKGECTVKGALPDPPLAVAFRLKSALTREGIPVEGKVLAALQSPQSGLPVKGLDTLYSQPLDRLLELMLIHSNNLFAENMICLLAPDGKKESGIKALQENWPSRAGVRHKNFIYDGSGLSPMNAVTPYSLAEASADWYASMGKKGLKEKVPGVFVKSGYMERVRSYTGIIEKPGKPPMAFAFIVNHYRCGPPEMRRQMEKIMNAF